MKPATRNKRNVAVYRFQGGNTQLQTKISLPILLGKYERESYDTPYLVP
jgi:hypothetical protein